jgi:hypothetical protein
MSNAVEDGQTNPMIRRLANVGDGKHAHSGLNRLLLRETGLANMVTTVPDGDISDIILPSRMVSMLFQHHMPLVGRIFGADTASLRAFWTQFLNRDVTKEWAAAHPHLAGKEVADLVSTVPLSIHLDAGPVTKRKSTTVISWTAILGQSSEKTGQFVVGSYIKTGPQTTNDAWRLILEDFDRLATGVVDGQTVAPSGRARGCFMFVSSTCCKGR